MRQPSPRWRPSIDLPKQISGNKRASFLRSRANTYLQCEAANRSMRSSKPQKGLLYSVATVVIGLVFVAAVTLAILDDFAVNMGRVILTKELADRSQEDALAQTNVSSSVSNWIRLAECCAPTSESTRALAFEASALGRSFDSARSEAFSGEPSEVKPEGTALWFRNRPVSRYAQYLISLNLAERFRKDNEVTEALWWYWRLFALLPNSVPPQAGFDYYDTLGRVLLADAVRDQSMRSFVVASKAFWMAEDLDAALQAVDPLLERTDLAAEDQSWISFVLGMQAERSGNSTLALRHYKESFEKAQAFPFAIFHHPELAKLDGVYEWRQADWTRVELPLNDFGVAHVRFIVDPDILAMGLHVPIAVLWELPDRNYLDPMGVGGTMTIADGQWLSYGIAENHIRNGGFEWTIPAECGSLLGWGHGEIDSPEPVRMSEVDTGTSTYVGRFPSKRNGVQTIYLAERAVNLDANSYLLGGAQMRIEPTRPNQATSGWLGVWWPESVGWLMSSESTQWRKRQLAVGSPESPSSARVGLWVIPKEPGVSGVLVDQAWLVQLPRVVVP